MGKKRGLYFDFKNCDVIAEVMDEAGIHFSENRAYFDLGCSSGRTLRTLYAAIPGAHWIGADPVPESINCARIMFPYIEFIESKQKPPIPNMKKHSLDGLFALSVWSHFSVRAGKQWMKEVARVVKPGGFFLFSAIGYFQLAKQLIQERRSYSFLKNALDTLEEEGFYFYNTIKDGHRGLKNKDWGLAFMGREWMQKSLLSKEWELLLYKPGRWGNKQDIYLLRRK
jgi:SAM-dependent methyltransferase